MLDCSRVSIHSNCSEFLVFAFLSAREFPVDSRALFQLLIVVEMSLLASKSAEKV
jgi:hypothetical protein